jgi:ElaA protein
MENQTDIHSEFLDFPALTTLKLYAILRARAEVFITEEKVASSEIDGLDLKTYHLVGWSEPNVVAAYLRLIPPGEKYQEPSFGRVLTSVPYRRKGLGRKLTQLAIEHARKLYPKCAIRISAQYYLEKFYQEFGFQTVSGVYDDVGIPHIDMLLAANK